MKLEQAKELAIKLMQEHGLNDWSFKFDHAKRRFGACNYTKKTISLSKHLSLLNSCDEVQDTILHEIAHALCPRDGHGKLWQAKCREIGAKPERLYTAEQVKGLEANYILYCPNCNFEHERFRRSRKKYYCASCCKKYNNNRVDQRFLLKWRLNTPKVK